MLRHWLQLALTDGIGPILQTRLVNACESAEAACDATISTLRNIEGIGAAKAQQIHDALKHADEQVDEELRKAHALGVDLVCRDDPAYPALLKEIPDPPPVLYVKGRLEPRDLNAVAIVGSRKCSLYGREQAERFGALLAGAAITVISGGARGIDSAAHRGALQHANGRTIAVLGSGVDVPYPPENHELFAQIAKRGAVISEYPIGTPPVAENFPRRNRIVSGMSRGVLVIEADERSGALITARQACDDHGRPVFALPGRVDNKLSTGPHKLIRDGAILATGLGDIIEGIGPLPQSAVDTIPPLPEHDAPEPPATEVCNQNQQTILEQLDGQSLDVETIIERTSLPAHQVMQELTFLGLRGLVKRDGQLFARSSARR